MNLPLLHVLLLGWDDAPRPAEAARPAALALARQLAPSLALAVLLPRLPEVVEPLAQGSVTGLGHLDPRQVATVFRPAGAWQTPASPYLGATPPAPAPAPAASAGSAAPAAPEAAAAGAAPAPEAAAPAPKANLAPAAAPAAARPARPVAPAEPDAAGQEPGPEEAQDLFDPADDLTPDPAPAEAADPAPALLPTVQALTALRHGDAAGSDLNFRVIQYARFAVPQALAQEFAVIYAADWPVWLAAMELRQRTGRPLVLHVHSLAADRNTPDDRGWALELERLALRRADLVLAATPALADRLRQLYPAAAARCQVVAADDAAGLHAALHRLTPAA